jgi:hypothetical protein
LSALLLQSTPSKLGWTDVVALAPNVSIRVRLDAGAVTGTFVSATPDILVVDVNGRNVPIVRASIKAVDRARGKPHRARNVGIGFLAGAGAGLLLQKARCEGNNCMAEAAFVYTVPLELIGAIAGAVAPAQSWQTIYRR